MKYNQKGDNMNFEAWVNNKIEDGIIGNPIKINDEKMAPLHAVFLIFWEIKALL